MEKNIKSAGLSVERRNLLMVGLGSLAAAFCPSFIYSASFNDANRIKVKAFADLSGCELTGDQLFREIASLGCDSFIGGIMLYDAYKNRPGELKKILRNAGIRDWMLDAGTMPFNGSDLPETMQLHKRYLAFGSEAGAGTILFRPEKRDSYPPGKLKLQKLAAALDEAGKSAREKGMRVLFSNQMHSICQTADEFLFTIISCRSGRVEMLLDTAMLLQAGDNPAAFILKEQDKLAGIRFNDITRPLKGFAGSRDRNYRAEFPGSGNSQNYAEITSALDKIRFRGMGIIGIPVQEEACLDFKVKISSGIEFLRKTGILR